MNLYQETKFLMDRYHITANKRLGQNFLIEEEVVEDIIEAAQVSKEDLVIEIGPGLGTLTAYLLEKANKVIAVELDTNMCQILKERFAFYSNLEILQQDILKVDLKEKLKEAKNNPEIRNVKIVANLPYYITTPIIMKLLEEKLDISSITVMIQKEVAQRFTTLPGEKKAGAITYSVFYYAQAKTVRKVPHTAFIPQPEVESEVICLTVREEPIVKVRDEKLFFRLIKASFEQRRKTLINGIGNSGIVQKETLKQILQQLQIDVNVRGENLSIQQFAMLADRIGEIQC